MEGMRHNAGTNKMTTPNQAPEVSRPVVEKNVAPVHLSAPEVLALLRDLAYGYTRHHGDLKVQAIQMDSILALSMQGNKDDHGRLVGDQGRNIRSLQMIFTRIGRKIAQPIELTLVPPIVGRQEKISPFAPDPKFKHGATTALLLRCLKAAMARPFSLAMAEGIGSTEYELTPAAEELPIVRGALIEAIYSIFHAVGKNRGRIIRVSLNDPAPAPEPEKVIVLRSDRSDDLDREVESRGLE